jgi:hypothetical protein
MQVWQLVHKQVNVLYINTCTRCLFIVINALRTIVLSYNNRYNTVILDNGMLQTTGSSKRQVQTKDE